MPPVLKEVFRRIRIVPISSILLHEGVVEDWTQKLSTTIDHDGIVKNPIIVTRLGGRRGAGARGARYVALDGMHRISALKALGCRDILVYEVDYFNPSIVLHGWDALLLDPFPVREVLGGCVERAGGELLCHRAHARGSFAMVAGNVGRHQACLGLLCREGEVYEARLAQGPPDLDTLIRLLQDFEGELDRRRVRVVYVADEQSLATFEEHPGAGYLLKRPYFTKEEVVRRSVEGKVLPRKSTRHLFPMRPLRVDIDFILLREEIDLRIKNRLLQARLDWLLEHNMVRYYPESVLVLSD